MLHILMRYIVSTGESEMLSCGRNASGTSQQNKCTTLAKDVCSRQIDRMKQQSHFTTETELSDIQIYVLRCMYLMQ